LYAKIAAYLNNIVVNSKERNKSAKTNAGLFFDAEKSE